MIDGQVLVVTSSSFTASGSDGCSVSPFMGSMLVRALALEATAR